MPQNTALRDAPGDIPPKLLPLMLSTDITEDEIRTVFAEKGYYPKDTPWSVLQSEGFVDGWIIPYWTNIVDAIMTLRTNQSVPF